MWPALLVAASIAAEPSPPASDRPETELFPASPRGHTVAAPPTPEPPDPKWRLRAIDDELKELTERRTGRQVFTATSEKALPILLVGAAPLIILGALGIKGTGSIDTNDYTGKVVLWSGVGLLCSAALLATIGVISVIEHWISESETWPQRKARATALEAERQQLLAQPPH